MHNLSRMHWNIADAPRKLLQNQKMDLLFQGRERLKPHIHIIWHQLTQVYSNQNAAEDISVVDQNSDSMSHSGNVRGKYILERRLLTGMCEIDSKLSASATRFFF